jgi:hypothetical protein
MKRAHFFLFAALMAAASCAAPEPAPSADDPVGGVWDGDWGMEGGRRDRVSLELRWEDGKLQGTVNPGRNGLDLTRAAFDKATGAITMEFDAYDDGRPVHFTIDGKVEGTVMAGTWTRNDQKGDFRVTRE